MNARTPRRRKPARKFAPHNTVAALWPQWSALEDRSTPKALAMRHATRSPTLCCLRRGKSCDRSRRANAPPPTTCSRWATSSRCGSNSRRCGMNARPMVARFKADVARLVPGPAADVALLARVAEFHRLRAVSLRLDKEHAKLRAKIEARPDFSQAGIDAAAVIQTTSNRRTRGTLQRARWARSRAPFRYPGAYRGRRGGQTSHRATRLWQRKRPRGWRSRPGGVPKRLLARLDDHGSGAAGEGRGGMRAKIIKPPTRRATPKP
jgi:hypothetical protein